MPFVDYLSIFSWFFIWVSVFGSVSYCHQLLCDCGPRLQPPLNQPQQMSLRTPLSSTETTLRINVRRRRKRQHRLLHLSERWAHETTWCRRPIRCHTRWRGRVNRWWRQAVLLGKRMSLVAHSRRSRHQHVLCLWVYALTVVLDSWLAFSVGWTLLVYLLASLVYKVLNTGRPPYLTDLLHYHKSARFMRSSANHLLSVPRHNLSFGTRAFCVSAQKYWTLHICQSQTYSSFRCHLKTHYFQSAYPAL